MKSIINQSDSLSPEDFDYILPKELIAQYPLRDRDASKLLVLSRDDGAIEHTVFSLLDDHLSPGDLLILNDTRVMAARLLGAKETGGAVEILLLRKLPNEIGESSEGDLLSSTWLAMAKSSKGLKIGAKVNFDQDLTAQVVERDGEYYKITLSHPEKDGDDIENLLERVALTPLPPYIDREPFADDRLRYQTVYARVSGAVAAPTAGLHFTSGILDSLKSKGVDIAYVTLHTGPGTFKPVRTAKIKDHKMHTEEYSIDEGVFDKVRCAKEEGRRVVAVGTTSTRTLEAAVAGPGGFDEPVLRGETGIFIYPGFKFQVVDALLTNFHLPRSTLIMLVSAFATKDLIFKAYAEAIDEGYRFFSYGDCMLIT